MKEQEKPTNGTPAFAKVKPMILSQGDGIFFDVTAQCTLHRRGGGHTKPVGGEGMGSRKSSRTGRRRDLDPENCVRFQRNFSPWYQGHVQFRITQQT